MTSQVSTPGYDPILVGPLVEEGAGFPVNPTELKLVVEFPEPPLTLGIYGVPAVASLGFHTFSDPSDLFVEFYLMAKSSDDPLEGPVVEFGLPHDAEPISFPQGKRFKLEKGPINVLGRFRVGQLYYKKFDPRLTTRYYRETHFVAA